MTSPLTYTLKTIKLGLLKESLKESLISSLIYCVAKHMRHNQSDNVYNTVKRSFITFGSHSKVRGRLTPLGGPHHLCVHLLHTERQRCFRRLFYIIITIAYVVLLHEKRSEMIGKCSQLVAVREGGSFSRSKLQIVAIII